MCDSGSFWVMVSRCLCVFFFSGGGGFFTVIYRVECRVEFKSGDTLFFVFFFFFVIFILSSALVVGHHHDSNITESMDYL